MRPKRDYTDYHRFVPDRYREEVYAGDDNWLYYYNIDWEDFLTYAMILYHKNYAVEGGAPDWFMTYIDEIKVVPFDSGGQDITLTFHKPGWIRNTLTYHLKDGVTPGGMTYNVTSKIEPLQDFLNGKTAIGCPQSTWQPYVLKRIENLRYGVDWRPQAGAQ